MIVNFDKSFSNSLDKFKSEKILLKVQEIIIECEEAENFTKISNLKKLKGFQNYYRIKFGDYRVGVQVEKNELTL